MTTTTAEATDTVNIGPDLNPQPAHNLPAVAAPAAVPAEFDEFNLAVRRMLGLEEASDGEIELFFHVCHKSGLDPFNKEVYMIGRNTEVAKWEPVDEDEPDGQKRKVKRWVTKYTIQTGINGFRKRAREIADAKGVEFRQDDPLWCGDDGVWREIWPEKKPPTAAKFVLYRDGHRYSFVAHYEEYVQKSGQPAEPNSMWSKMPRNQLRKCAEAGAIQAAFPDEMAGLILDDDSTAPNEPVVLDVDDDGNTSPAAKPATRRGGKGVGGLADRAAAAAEPQPEREVIDAEQVDDPQAEPAQEHAEPEKAKTARRRAFEKRLFALLGDAKVAEREDRLAIYRAVLERPDVQSTNDLDDDAVAKVSDQLYAWQKDKRLDAEITEILNTAALIEENKAQQSHEGNQR